MDDLAQLGRSKSVEVIDVRSFKVTKINLSNNQDTRFGVKEIWFINYQFSKF